MRVVNDMNRTINSRRSRKLNIAQQIKIDRHLKMSFLCRRLKSLLQIFQNRKCFIVSTKETSLYDYYRQVYKAHRNLKR